MKKLFKKLFGWIPGGIWCLAIVFLLFGYLGSRMGTANMLNTIMNTAHDLPNSLESTCTDILYFVQGSIRLEVLCQNHVQIVNFFCSLFFELRSKTSKCLLNYDIEKQNFLEH